jgi:hypothetical protein
MAHTIGADGVFATFARAARLRGDGSLLEWRNAAACARGRSRPDGYGLLQMGRREHGFFLEFDRGTVHPAALRAKFAAYHRYESGNWASRDYESFPPILVVTTGPGSEQRIVNAVRAAGAGRGNRLVVLITTVGWIENNSQGPFGSIWLDPERGIRRSWPAQGQDNCWPIAAGGREGSDVAVFDRVGRVPLADMARLRDSSVSRSTAGRRR